MKKSIVVVAFALTAQFALSQTTIPSGIISFTSSSQSPTIVGNNQNTSKSLIISTGDGTPSTGSYIHMFPTNTSNYSNGSGNIDLCTVGTSSAGDGIVFTNYDPATSQWKRLLVARKDGKVLIGNNIWTNFSYPGTYNLYVENGILTEKVRVALRSTSHWADYVFSPDYEIMPLDKLKDFVKSNKHLPGVPSAEELTNEGLDIGKMQAKQMEKIEELTLYIIQLNEKILELENKLIDKSGKQQ